MRDNLMLEEELNALKNDSVSTYQKKLCHLMLLVDMDIYLFQKEKSVLN